MHKQPEKIVKNPHFPYFCSLKQASSRQMPIRTFPERDPQTKFTMNFYLSSLDLRKGIIRSVIAVLLGVIFLIAPDLLPNTLVIILGATILFVGIVSFLTIFTKDGGKPVGINYFNLALSLIVGIVLLLFPDFFVALLMILLGIILIICGIGQISSLTSVRKWGVKANPFEYIIAILLILLGVVICFNPFDTKDVIFWMFGIGAIIYGITNLISLIRIRKNLEKAGKRVSHGNIEDVDYTLEK